LEFLDLRLGLVDHIEEQNLLFHELLAYIDHRLEGQAVWSEDQGLVADAGHIFAQLRGIGAADRCYQDLSTGVLELLELRCVIAADIGNRHDRDRRHVQCGQIFDREIAIGLPECVVVVDDADFLVVLGGVGDDCLDEGGARHVDLE
jgi:hypothetical protein